MFGRVQHDQNVVFWWMPSCRKMKEPTCLMHVRIDCACACISECAPLQQALAISLFVRSIHSLCNVFMYSCPARLCAALAFLSCVLSLRARAPT